MASVSGMPMYKKHTAWHLKKFGFLHEDLSTDAELPDTQISHLLVTQCS
jgi:hypothetical protein